MAAVPKKKTSQSRKGHRRQAHQANAAYHRRLFALPQPKIARPRCPTCGYYSGREVIAPPDIATPTACLDSMTEARDTVLLAAGTYLCQSLDEAIVAAGFLPTIVAPGHDGVGNLRV